MAACLWIHLLLRVLKCVCERVCVLPCVWTICIKSRAEVDGRGAASHRELSTILHPSQSPSGCLSVNLKQKSIVCFDRHWNPFPVSVICWVNPFELTIYSVSASWICRPIGMWQEGWAPQVRRTHFWTKLAASESNRAEKCTRSSAAQRSAAHTNTNAQTHCWPCWRLLSIFIHSVIIQTWACCCPEGRSRKWGFVSKTN